MSAGDVAEQHANHSPATGGKASKSTIESWRRHVDANANVDLTPAERKAYQGMLQARWKALLRRDQVGFQGDRLYQFGELTADLVDEVIAHVHNVWPEVPRETVESSVETFHAYLLHKNVGAGNRILVGKKPVLVGEPGDVAAPELLEVGKAEEPEQETPGEQEKRERGANAEESSDEEDEDYSVSASEAEAEEAAEEAAEEELMPGLDPEEQDIEIVLEEEEADGQTAEKQVAGDNDAHDDEEGFQSPVATPRQATSAPPTFDRTSGEGGKERESPALAEAQGPLTAQPSPGEEASAEEEGATPPTPAGRTTRLGSKGPASAMGAAKRRKPTLLKEPPATAPVKGKKRKASTDLREPPSIEGVVESMLAFDDSTIKRLLTEKRMSEKRAADKLAEADRVKEQMKKTESEVAKTTAALEKANTELVEIAKRIEDIKRFQDKATSKSSKLEEHLTQLLSEAEAEKQAMQEKAEAVAAKKHEAKEKLERSLSKIMDIAQKKYG